LATRNRTQKGVTPAMLQRTLLLLMVFSIGNLALGQAPGSPEQAAQAIISVG
jgi:hypothetical protein